MLEILGTIGFDWHVALANLVSFLIIFWILKRYAFKPIARIIKERQDKIKEGLDNADQAEEDLLNAKEEYSSIIKGAKKEATGIVTSATDQGKDIVEEAVAKSDVQAKDIIDQAHKQIETDREAMQSEVESRAAEVIVDGVEKILMEEFTEKENASFNKKALSVLKK